jgi:hypothetical protein
VTGVTPPNYPRVGFIVRNMSRRAERVVAFYSKRETCEQWIKEGKEAILLQRANSSHSGKGRLRRLGSSRLG